MASQDGAFVKELSRFTRQREAYKNARCVTMTVVFCQLATLAVGRNLIPAKLNMGRLGFMSSMLKWKLGPEGVHHFRDGVIFHTVAHINIRAAQPSRADPGHNPGPAWQPCVNVLVKRPEKHILAT